MIASGISLAALEQQVISVVTVNGRSAAVFAEAHSGTPVFGPLTAQRQSKLQRVLRGSLDAGSDIRPLADLARLPLTDGAADDIVGYIIEDPQMSNWPEARREPAIPQLENCRAWVRSPRGTRPAGACRIAGHNYFSSAGRQRGSGLECHRSDLDRHQGQRLFRCS
jgi:hypothetical protein